MRNFPLKFPAILGLAALLLGAMGMVPLGGQESSESVLPSGVKAVWDLEKAFRETTPTRERVSINGLWRWQPVREAQGKGVEEVPAGGWGYFKVPGPWPGRNDWMMKESQNVYAHPSWKDENLSRVTSAWYQRQVSIPKEWAGRRVLLSLEYLNSYAAVYVDGKKAGELRFPAGDLDLTSICRPGTKHLLSLFVVAAPLKAVMVSHADTSTPKTEEGSVERRGLCGDVWLAGIPARTRISGVRAITSVQKWEFTLEAALEGLQPGTKYFLSALIKDGKRPLKKLKSRPFGSKDLRDGRFSFTAKWKPAKLWDLDKPGNQFTLALSLKEASGSILDTALPERFGFRELWIEGRDYILNGSRISCSALPEDNCALGAGMANYAACRETLERLKRNGFNALYGHNYGCEPGSHLSFEEFLRAADDVGMLVFFSQPHFEQYDWDAADADKTNGYAQHAAFYVHVAGNHPSVVMYAMSHNATGYGEENNPDMMDGLDDPRRDEWALRNSRRAVRAEAIVRGLDPSRVIYHHSSGNLGTMHTINFYLNFVPGQELSDWFEHWGTKGVKPLFLCEFGCPLSWDWTMYRGWYKGQREFGSAPVPWELCQAEWSSQFLGNKAYALRESDKRDLRWEAKQFAEGKVWHRWDYPTPVGENLSDAQNEVFAGYFRDSLRALRTWGVSGYCVWDHEQHWKLGEGVARGRQDLPVDWDGLQRPGFSPDYVDDRYHSFEMGFERSDWKPTVAGEALIQNNLPLLAYIGGGPTRFTNKGHDYFPGETVEKQLILLNNSRGTVACDTAWSLAPALVSGWEDRVVLKAGQQKRIPLRFVLPQDASGTVTLSATFQFDKEKPQQDALVLSVLPHATTPRLPGKAALFDPKGETAQTLSGLGIACDKVGAGADLSPYDLLIIGKSALTPDGPGPDLKRVREGLKVIVFEQGSEALEKRLGFRVEEYGLRQVFKRISAHPLLAGIGEDNLRDWRGDATLLPSRLTYEMKPEHGPIVKWCGLEVARPWRCGCQGSVASVLIEKPARGNFLSILDGGYSLQYSPLMEYREGKGMVLFCQMDVTGRTEAEPAAEQLVKNLLLYASAWKPAPARKAVYVGEAAGKEYLESLGLTLDPFGSNFSPSEAFIVGPGGGEKMASRRGEVADWLKKGGNLLALGLDEKEANAFLPFKVSMKKEEHIATVFEPLGADSPLAGLGSADVHNRAPKEFSLIAGGAKAVGDGVLGVAEDSHAVFCQMVPWQFNYAKNYGLKRTFRKASFLAGRLIANMGVECSTPLLARFQDPVDPSKQENRWLTGLYLDQPEEWDDPYRYFGW